MDKISKILAAHKSRLLAVAGISGPLLVMAIQARPHNSADFLLLVGLAGIGLLLPDYARWCNAIEDRINIRLVCVTCARVLRITYPLPLIITTIWVLPWSQSIALLSGWSTLLLPCAVAGLQSIMVDLSYRGAGDRNSNTIIAFASSLWLICIQAVPVVGVSVALLLLGFYIYYLIKGFLSDARSIFYPRHGIGIFFGTFNPIHKTHIWIIANAIEDRKLSKVYIHPTTVPKLHRDAIKNGELIIDYEHGMRVYRLSNKADRGKNYFPTGNKFYEYEVRSELIRAALDDAGLSGKAELLEMPQVYETSGFSGVIQEIKRRNSNVPIHGLHGSDTGGMWVRNIFDNSGWVYPYPIIRSNNVSATAIRAGAVGYTTATVEKFLESTRKGRDFIFPNGHKFSYEEYSGQGASRS